MTRQEAAQLEMIEKIMRAAGHRVEFVGKGGRPHAKARIVTPGGSIHYIGLTGSGRRDEKDMANFARQNAQRLLREIDSRKTA